MTAVEVAAAGAIQPVSGGIGGFFEFQPASLAEGTIWSAGTLEFLAGTAQVRSGARGGLVTSLGSSGIAGGVKAAQPQSPDRTIKTSGNLNFFINDLSGMLSAVRAAIPAIAFHESLPARRTNPPARGLSSGR